MRDFVLVFVLLIFCTCLYGQVAEFENKDFKKADSVADLYPSHSLRDLRTLALKLAAPLSTEEDKFRSIYKWVCSNIENDYSLFKKINISEKNSKTRNNSTRGTNNSAKLSSEHYLKNTERFVRAMLTWCESWLRM